MLVCLLGIALVCADDMKPAAPADAPSAVARRLRGGIADDADEVTSDGGVSDALVAGPAAADCEDAADEPTAAPPDEDEPSGLEAVEESSSPTERRLGKDKWYEIKDKLKTKWNKIKRKIKDKWYGGGGYY
ncbi:unnamed protein product [Vitrella brassicaformis CCMP3155]|uniref:Uncharacterized protein n=1 Tax=Vitrella brassicaformis (strain CCMP3155) TaxID=1169540 RepID=A0A0G4GPA5_VITBC|nr:unnamed protein product [Vitrella brassicaformis CCMP3155]|eukprot:CEM32205.1 unnamed protein product [Vitrella brassicaformis CCMP3155]